MHRQDLLIKLNDCPPSPARARFLRFVTEHDDCFARTLAKGHITGSAWVMNAAGTHTALVLHKRLGIWVQPGGHADGVADTLAVAWAEAREETGLTSLMPVSHEIFDLDVHVIPANAKEAQHEHYDVRYAFRAMVNEECVVSEESLDVRWVDLDDLENYSKEESVLRMRNKWKEMYGSRS